MIRELDSLRTARSRTEPIAASTKRLPSRMAANTVAYLIDDPTHIAMPQSPNNVAADVTIVRASRLPVASWETSLRRIIPGFTREIASRDGTAKRITVARPAAIPFNMDIHGQIRMTA